MVKFNKYIYDYIYRRSLSLFIKSQYIVILERLVFLNSRYITTILYLYAKYVKYTFKKRLSTANAQSVTPKIGAMVQIPIQAAL